MGLFRPYEQGKTEQEGEATTRRAKGRSGATAAPAPAETVAPAAEATPAAADPQPVVREKGPKQPPKKGTRTPTRAEAEAARMERLHPTLTKKEAKRAEREASRQAQTRQLQAVDARPERVLLRSVIDARWSLVEWTMPLFLVMLVIMFTVARHDVRLWYWMNMGLTAFLVLAVLEVTWVWQRYKRIATDRGLQPKQRGALMYCLNRMMALRSVRQPRPVIERGAKY